MSSENERSVRAARNQSLFREINERLESLNEGFEELTSSSQWVCECADLGCIDRLDLTLEEYERIRQNASWFPVVPGHETPAFEQVIERYASYVVVEKLGLGADVARLRNPRG